VRHFWGARVIEVAGALTGRTALSFRASLDFVDDGGRRVVIDLHGLGCIDSEGVAALQGACDHLGVGRDVTVVGSLLASRLLRDDHDLGQLPAVHGVPAG
jgi:anti-anti-sigma regulatory factor